ncbi:MAG: hypothetical protein FGM46_08120, partial [Ferruginibacter sp.]|nr:hypothetical protein [Ferruginibacter sp.]
MKFKSSLLLFALLMVFSYANFAQKNMSEVRIGTQVWSSKNLDVDKFRNGDPIPEAKTQKEWLAAGKAGKPAWCY